MAFDTRPVTPDRVDDFAAVANPNRRSSHCWCLSHRLGAREITELGGGSREAAFRALCDRENPPGVIGYDDGEPFGWCSIGPRSENPDSPGPPPPLIRPLDAWPWGIICSYPGGHRVAATSP